MARVLVWLAGVILLLQLLGATQHRHDLAHQASDCAGCMLAAQPPSPPAPPVIVHMAVRAAVLYHLVHVPAPTPPTGSTGFLIPHAQAPPAAFM